MGGVRVGRSLEEFPGSDKMSYTNKNKSGKVYPYGVLFALLSRSLALLLHAPVDATGWARQLR